MIIGDKDITFELKGNTYKVPYCIMADNRTILERMKKVGLNFIMANELRCLKHSEILLLFEGDEFKSLLTSCFYKAGSLPLPAPKPTEPFKLTLSYNF
jgi:hypothetical protein